jgi:hypothetical protein
METSFYEVLLVRFLLSDVGQQRTTLIATIKTGKQSNYRPGQALGLPKG